MIKIYIFYNILYKINVKPFNFKKAFILITIKI